jgi:hypothetical protein
MAVLLLTILLRSACAAADAKVLRALRVDAPPVVDGRLDEACWRDADTATGFSVIGDAGTAADEQTVGRAVYDNECLYVGVECRESRLDLLREVMAKSPQTFDYEAGETVELFFDVNRDRKTFLQILVNTNGSYQVLAAHEMQLRNVPVEPAVQLGDGAFSIEVKIPLAALHLTPNPEGIWGFNLCRARMLEGRPEVILPSKVFSAWQNTGWDFRQPDRFGALAIAGDFSCYHFTVDARQREGALRVEVTNGTGSERAVILETAVGKEKQRQAHDLRLRAGESWPVDLPMPPGAVEMEVNLREAKSGRFVYQGGTALAEVSASAAPALAAAAGGLGYCVFSTCYLERQTCYSAPRREQVGKALELFAALGEYEPASFSVRAEKDLTAVRVELAQGLTGPGGAAIGADRVDLRVVESMKRWTRATEYQKTECFLTRNRPRDLRAGVTQRYWLTVHVPDDAVAGRYRGSVRIAPANAEAQDIQVTLEVLPIILPRPVGMNFFMYLRPRDLPKEFQTDEYLRRVFLDMREHGMTSLSLSAYPGGPGWTSVDRDSQEPLSMARQIELLRETGLDAPWSALPWIGAECYPASTWKIVMDEAKKREWPELLFYLVDEPKPGRYERVDACMRQVADFRKQFPQHPIRTTTAGASDPKVAPLYDVWIAGASVVDAELLENAKKMGKVVWTYDCATAPVDAQTERYYFGLWAWKAGVKGAAQWAYTDGSTTNRFGVAVPWTGREDDLTEYTHSFNFVCPMAEGPVPSIGWEAVREGIDDYRYLLALTQLLEAARARKDVEAAAVEKAAALLRQAEEAVHIENYGKALQRASERGGYGGGLFDRPAPEPGLAPTDFDRIRREIAAAIVTLGRLLDPRAPRYGLPAATAAATPEPTPGPTPAAEARPADPPPPAADSPESLLDACEDLGIVQPVYNQVAWDPKAFHEQQIGQLAVSTAEKVEGRGSFHWVVTAEEVEQRLKKEPAFEVVAIQRLFGLDFEPYAEMSFNLKCDTSNHPRLYLQLLGAQAPSTILLDRGQTTQGWQEIRLQLSALDIGVSATYGKIMNYFRFYCAASAFEEGDRLDIYLDNLRLTTKKTPTELTAPRPAP